MNNGDNAVVSLYGGISTEGMFSVRQCSLPSVFEFNEAYLSFRLTTSNAAFVILDNSFFVTIRSIDGASGYAKE